MAERRRVLLVQLPIPPLGPQPIRGNVPLAAGYLKLLAEQRGLDSQFDIAILPADDANRLGDHALVERICEQDPWLVGFTCYLWNIDRTLWVAERIRARRPETRVMLGGPEITPDNAWVLNSACLDYAAIGEGEQTFAELLAHHAGGTPALASIAGLAHRNGVLRVNPPRRPMPTLDPISSPYLAGILNAGDQEQLLLETVRGCIFKCKFCYYPKAYDGLYYVSREKVLANLAHARANGAREVYLLDPTLNQRRDFTQFLELLRDGNPDGRLELYGELRGEGITPAHAELMRATNFKEVEIGLQSVDPVTQELMDRRNNLKAFEKGVRALQAAGIAVKVDLIIGLPGDTPDSIRRGMHYLADNRLYDDIQVFQLSVLPGTSFRQEAAALGLEYQPRPPYYVLRTPRLALDDMLGLLEESEEIFETEFDPLPPPALDIAITESSLCGRPRCEPGLRGWRVDLDEEPARAAPPDAAQAFTLWLRSADLYRRLPRAERIVREFLSINPFATLQIILETNFAFPFDVFDRLRAACARPENIYLDRFYAFMPGRPAGARRLVTLLPSSVRGQVSYAWVEDALAHSDLVWVDPGPNLRSVAEAERCGEWQWLRAGAAAHEPAHTAAP